MQTWCAIKQHHMHCPTSSEQAQEFQPAAGRRHPQVWASAERTGQEGLPASQGRNLASYLAVEAMNKIRRN